MLFRVNHILNTYFLNKINPADLFGLGLQPNVVSNHLMLNYTNCSHWFIFNLFFYRLWRL